MDSPFRTACTQCVDKDKKLAEIVAGKDSKIAAQEVEISRLLSVKRSENLTLLKKVARMLSLVALAIMFLTVAICVPWWAIETMRGPVMGAWVVASFTTAGVGCVTSISFAVSLFDEYWS